MQKSSPYLQNYRKLWLIWAKIIFCPPHTWMRFVFGGRTSICRNLFNIGLNDMIFLLKDGLLNSKKIFWILNLCTINRFRDIYSWSCHCLTSYSVGQIFTKILSKIKLAATLLQFGDEVCQIVLIRRKHILKFRIRNNSLQKSSPYLQN